MPSMAQKKYKVNLQINGDQNKNKVKITQKSSSKTSKQHSSQLIPTAAVVCNCNLVISEAN